MISCFASIKKSYFLLSFVLLFVYRSASAQSSAIESFYQEYLASANGEINTKVIDLDKDTDLDYVFTYPCGEAMCLKIVLDINGTYKEVIDEFGRLSVELENSPDFTQSVISLKSQNSHCCGESPFRSYRSFVFEGDKAKIVDNYVLYDPWQYNEEDNHRLQLLPLSFHYLPNFYPVRINKQGYNIRFSADLESHPAYFTCVENSNVIAQLKMGAVVNVLGSSVGDDQEERTWLYVEVGQDALFETDCVSPLSYEFKDQKLRGWISDKYTTKL